jgi:inosose dehydratase
VHVKDLRDKTDKESQVNVGRGALDIGGFFRALTRIGYAGHVGLEYEITPDGPQAGIKESFAYMRGVNDMLAG